MVKSIVFSLLLAVCAWSQEKDVQAAERGWAAAIQARDAAALERLLGDGLIYAHSTGIIDSKRDYIAKISSGRQKYEGVEQQSATVKLYGDAAVVHARMRMWGVNQNGKFDDRLMMLHLWVRQAGRWQLAAHQTTKLP
jgi:ketosteroid isomerase-like protein